jgi:hypothetical protein
VEEGSGGDTSPHDSTPHEFRAGAVETDALRADDDEAVEVIENVSLFWLAVLYIAVRLTLADSKAVLLAHCASLRLFSCSYFTYM